MRRKTLLNRNVIIVLMLFIFLMTAFVSTAYSFWYFPNSENPKTVNADMKVDDIEENFTNTGSYLKIIDCRDGVIPKDTDFAIKNGSVFLDNSKNFSKDGKIFIGKNNNYSKKVFGVSSSNVNVSYKFPLNPTLLNPNPEGGYVLGSFVSSVFYRSGTSITSSGTSATDSDTSMTEIYLYDLLNSKYKLVDHLTNESIELRNKNVTSSDGGDMGEPLDAKSYSSTKFEDYRKNIGYSFSKSRILFLVPRDTETPPEEGNYNIYFNDNGYYSNNEGKLDLDHVWLWNDRTDFGVSLALTDCSKTNKDGTIYNKSVNINYETLYQQVCNDFYDTTKKSGFIMTPQTAPTGIVFKTENGTDFAPKDKHGNIEYLALPLPPKDSTSFDIYINVDKENGKFTIKTDQDVDLTKNKNIVFYSVSGLDHLWTWSSSISGVDRWISSNYVYKFNMADCNKTVSCFSYNYGEKFNFYKNWKGPTPNAGTLAEFSPGFTFDKNEAGEKIGYNYDRLILVDYDGASQTGKDKDISELFNGTSECNGDCTSIYLLEKNKEVFKYLKKSEFIAALNQLN